MPPFNDALAMRLISTELGAPIPSLFSEITPAAVAAASLGQVYRGRLHDGTEVAVKVQRPGMAEAIALDLFLLRILLSAVRTAMRMRRDLRELADGARGPPARPGTVFAPAIPTHAFISRPGTQLTPKHRNPPTPGPRAEIGVGLFCELDYRVEAENSAAFSDAHCRALPFVVVPRPVGGMVTRKVLVMEWRAPGPPRSTADSSCLPASSRCALATDGGVACSAENPPRHALLPPAATALPRRINGARVADLLAACRGDGPDAAAAVAGAKRLVDMGAQCSLAQLLQTASAAPLLLTHLLQPRARPPFAPAPRSVCRRLFVRPVRAARCEARGAEGGKPLSALSVRPRRASCTRTPTGATCSSPRTCG